MAFTMKGKSIIQGTERHSALLAKAKTEAEIARTHGGDPILTGAAGSYGESMIPDVIDYTIKQRKIKWDKKQDDTKSDPDPESTINDRKENDAKKDSNIATNKLIENQKKKLEKKLNEPPPKTLSEEAKQKQLEINRFTEKEIKRLDELRTDYGSDELPYTPTDPNIDYESLFPPEKETDDIPTTPPPPPKHIPAHKNPDYEENWVGNMELGKQWKKYDPNNSGYTLTIKDGKEQWTYKGRNILASEVDSTTKTNIRPVIVEEQKKKEIVTKTKEQKKKEIVTKTEEKKTEKKKDSKPRPWQYKTVKSYNEAKAAWKAKQ